jgi:hypothetical protein
MKENQVDPTGESPQDVQSLAHTIKKVWEANREFQLRDIKFEDFTILIAEYDEVLGKIEIRNRELNELRITRDKLEPKVKHLSTRARTGMRGYFGPKSSEYQRIRPSLRKNPAPKARKPAKKKPALPPTPPPPDAPVTTPPAK